MRAHVAIDLAIATLGHYDSKAKREIVDAGRYELMVGASSADIRGSTAFEVTP